MMILVKNIGYKKWILKPRQGFQSFNSSCYCSSLLPCCFNSAIQSYELPNLFLWQCVCVEVFNCVSTTFPGAKKFIIETRFWIKISIASLPCKSEDKNRLSVGTMTSNKFVSRGILLFLQLECEARKQPRRAEAKSDGR